MTETSLETDVAVYELRPRMPAMSRCVTHEHLAFLMVLFSIVFLLTGTLTSVGIPGGDPALHKELLAWVVFLPPALVAWPVVIGWLPWTLLAWFQRRRTRNQSYRFVVRSNSVCVARGEYDIVQQVPIDSPMAASFVLMDAPERIENRFMSVRFTPCEAGGALRAGEGLSIRSAHIGSDDQMEAFAAWLAQQGIVTRCELPPVKKPPRSIKLNRECILVFAFSAALWLWCLFMYSRA